MLVGMALLRSTALDDAGFVHAFPERTATQAELLALPRGHRDRAGETGAWRWGHRSVRRERSRRTRGGRGGRSSLPFGDRRRRACRRLRPAARGRRGQRGRRGDPRRLARRRRRRRPGGNRRSCAAAGGARGSSRRSDLASAGAASRWDRTSRRRSCGPRTARACSRTIGATNVGVDLRAAVRAQLLAAGVSAGRIEDVPGCTRHEADRFHSFRRDGANSARMLAVIKTRASRSKE